MLTKIFTILGLTAKDERIYLTSLKIGAQPASVIGKKAGFKRVDTYNHLRELRELGIFNMERRDGVKYFKACSPEKLSELIKVKKALLIEAEDSLNTVLMALRTRNID